jgi:GNAT superfamily N-acetyltransferase
MPGEDLRVAFLNRGTDRDRLALRRVPIDHLDAQALITLLDAHYRAVYGGGDATPIAAGQFAPPLGYFAVGYLDGVSVACGGWRGRDGGDPALRPGDAEIKRMFVVPEQRRKGYALALLAHLEATAAAAGRRRAVLETGVRQPDAIALYTRCGYRPMPPFGTYRALPGCRCFAKSLPAECVPGMA